MLHATRVVFVGDLLSSYPVEGSISPCWVFVLSLRDHHPYRSSGWTRTYDGMNYETKEQRASPGCLHNQREGPNFLPFFVLWLMWH